MTAEAGPTAEPTCPVVVVIIGTGCRWPTLFKLMEDSGPDPAVPWRRPRPHPRFLNVTRSAIACLPDASWRRLHAWQDWSSCRQTLADPLQLHRKPVRTAQRIAGNQTPLPASLMAAVINVGLCVRVSHTRRQRHASARREQRTAGGGRRGERERACMQREDSQRSRWRQQHCLRSCSFLRCSICGQRQVHHRRRRLHSSHSAPNTATTRLGKRAVTMFPVFYVTQ